MDGRDQGHLESAAGTCQVRRSRVIFADDSATQRVLVAALLSDRYDVVTVPDGQAALESARLVHPDVILSDIRMPGLDGLGLLRAIKDDEELRRVPFILVTSEEQVALRTIYAGADDYLTKPFGPEELRARVAAAVRSYRMYLELERQHAELVRVHEESKRLELELRSAQKLEAVGRLASGIAHEINTPIQFVSDNTRFLEGAFRGLSQVLEAQRAALAAAPLAEADRAAVEAVEAEVDLPYLREQLGPTFAETLEGLKRVAGIVRAMKEFAHPDQKEMTATDLNRAVLATLEVARNEYKYVADVETALEELPLVTCHAGDVNQVLLNVIVNAAHAIGDVMKRTGQRGRIRVESAPEGEAVRISIGDTGGGIPPEVQPHVFEPFFTTKEVGRGTGQGLAIAHSV
ncbi:MAG: response regulator, partial [Anaeromyxobacteraceae bacterium]|nr:response regulator [Anaeromyxobacteraceae bacterium]